LKLSFLFIIFCLEGKLTGILVKNADCISWVADQREINIVSLLGLELSRRKRSRNWAGSCGGWLWDKQPNRSPD
jgi:hypothetical protein